jgi:hypothetical protein
MDLRQESLTSGGIKVKEVHQQYDVVSLSELCRQSAAWHGVETVCDSRCLGVLLRDREHLRPVERDDLRLGVLPEEGDAVQPVPGRDVEHLHAAAGARGEEARQQRRIRRQARPR